jgi:hypothetical protein
VAAPNPVAPLYSDYSDTDDDPDDEFAGAEPDADRDVDPDEDELTDATPGGDHLEELADHLYDKLRDRLRRELLVDRERSLTLTDWR